MVNKESELADNELEKVAGGTGNKNATLDEVLADYQNAYKINLTGPYYATPNATGAPCYLAIGWSNLYVVNEKTGAAPYRITQGTYGLGWAPAGSFTRM